MKSGGRSDPVPIAVVSVTVCGALPSVRIPRGGPRLAGRFGVAPLGHDGGVRAAARRGPVQVRTVRRHRGAGTPAGRRRDIRLGSSPWTAVSPPGRRGQIHPAIRCHSAQRESAPTSCQSMWAIAVTRTSQAPLRSGLPLPLAPVAGAASSSFPVRSLQRVGTRRKGLRRAHHPAILPGRCRPKRVSPCGRPRRRGLRISAACACRPTATPPGDAASR
jgi:hypothetical protein